MLEGMNELQIVIFLALAMFIVNYASIPRMARFLKDRVKFGIDVHKLSRPKVAECGGIMILASLSVFLLLSYMLTSDIRVLYVLLIAAMFSIYGMVDDLRRLGKYQKLAFSVAISSMGAFLFGATGLYFALTVFFLVAASNIFNLFAGLNGMEVGTSAIIAFFFAVASLLLSNTVPLYMSVGMFSILLAFLAYNRYPARIFPGDVGTLAIGGFFASMALFYNMYMVLVPLLALHIADSLLKPRWGVRDC